MRLGRVPNAPRTQHRSVRVDNDDWADFEAAAKLAGTDRAKLLNAFIRWYLHRPNSPRIDRPAKEQVAKAVEQRKAQDVPERPATE